MGQQTESQGAAPKGAGGDLRHVSGKPCPVTGEPVPFGVTFTDHDLPGLFNACAACSDKDFKGLTELRDEREAAALAQAGGEP